MSAVSHPLTERVADDGVILQHPEPTRLMVPAGGYRDVYQYVLLSSRSFPTIWSFRLCPLEVFQNMAGIFIKFWTAWVHTEDYP